jgi:FkbM family methyltransferase
MTAFMKKFIRHSFTLFPTEKLLVLLLSKFPHNRLLKGLTPSNEYYPAKSIRRCRRQGINYSLDIHDYQNWLIYFYSESDSSFGTLSYVKKGDIVLDIGGNIGQTALMMAKKLGNTGRIYSFEPWPGTFQQLKKNLSLNPDISNKIQFENVALGAAPDNLMMYQDCISNNGGNRMVPQTLATSNGKVAVPVSTIDIFAGQHKLNLIDFIKIDVEGFEFKVLKGGMETIIKYKPLLFVELDDNNLREQGNNAKELIQLLIQLHYTIVNAATGSSVFETTNYTNCHFDILCTPG